EVLDAMIAPRNTDFRPITVVGAFTAASDTDGMSPIKPTSIAPDTRASFTAGPNENIVNWPLRPLRSNISVFCSTCAICASTVVVGCHPMRTWVVCCASAPIATSIKAAVVPQATEYARRIRMAHPFVEVRLYLRRNGSLVRVLQGGFERVPQSLRQR